MSLSPGEREALGEIETHLSGSDPRLAAMLTYGTTRRTRLRPARMSGPRRCPDPGELVRFLVVAIGLALVIGLAVAGVLMTHPATSPESPGPHHTDEVVPTSDYRYGSYP
jgi:hypothetical protein